MLYNIEDIILEEAVFDFQNKKNDPNLTELLLTNFLKKEDKDLKQGTEMITYLHGSLLDYVVTENLLLHFNELINIMLLQTLENRKVYLSDIPINYYKILLAESLDLKLLDEMFNETMKAMKQYGLQKDIFNMFSMIYGHVIQIPRDIHLYGVLNNIKKTQPDQEITIYVEMQHFDSFQKYFQIKRKETNNESFLGVKGKYEIDMVEKIAILDIMLETKGTQETKVKMMDFLKTNIKEKRIQELYDITFEKYSEIRNTF